MKSRKEFLEKGCGSTRPDDEGIVRPAVETILSALGSTFINGIVPSKFVGLSLMTDLNIFEIEVFPSKIAKQFAVSKLA